MNIHIVYAHHEPSSFTSALKNISLSVLAQAGHTIMESDLYGQGFHAQAGKIDFTTNSTGHFNYLQEQKKAVLNSWAFSPDIRAEIQKVQQADTLIFHFPIWWSSVPAILKGWFDRVLVMGGAWDDHNQIYEHGLLRGKRALVVAVAGDEESFYQPDGRHKTSLAEMLRPILHGTFAYTGMDVLDPYIVYGMNSMSDEDRAAKLEDFQRFIENMPDNPNFYSRYDDGHGVAAAT